MGLANKTHWIGVFLLFAASVLLLIVTISAPVLNDVGFLKITLTNKTDIRHSSISFGTFGYCVLDVPPDNTDQDYCTGSHIGYAPAEVVARADHTDISTIASGTSDGLTRVMILHPIECGIAFIAFLLACGSGFVGSFVGAMVALLAWILTLVSLAVDFSLFGILRHHVNEDGSGSHAAFGIAIWCLLAAFVCLFFGMIIVFFTCCANRREKKRQQHVVEKERSSPPRRRKRFGIF